VKIIEGAGKSAPEPGITGKETLKIATAEKSKKFMEKGTQGCAKTWG
jgi:hypothetical protein